MAEFTVEGLTLLNGKAASASVGNGGGLLVNAGTEGLVTVRHNQLLNNIGSDGGGAYMRAGIISLTSNSSIQQWSAVGEDANLDNLSVTIQ